MAHTGNTKLLGPEKRLDLLNGESFKRSLDDFNSAQRLLLCLLGEPANFVENFLSEPSGSLVLMRDTLNCSNCLILTTTRDQELRGLVESEQEETAKEHAEGNGTKGQNQISPTPVVGLGTSGIVRAGEVGNECPRKHTGNQSTDRPPSSETT